MHFYTRTADGTVEPRHFIAQVKDPSKTRPSRITDATKASKTGELWLPSVTGIIDMLEKPALRTWFAYENIQTLVELVADGFDVTLMELNDLQKLVGAKTQERLDMTPAKGSDIHNALELAFKGLPYDKQYQKAVDGVADLFAKHGVKHSPECFEKYIYTLAGGYAGCSDVFTDMWVIDFKSKSNKGWKPSKMAYPEHAMQLASYDRAEPMSDLYFRRCANIFIDQETQEVDWHEWEHEQLEQAYIDFLSCRDLYFSRKYNPFDVQKQLEGAK